MNNRLAGTNSIGSGDIAASQKGTLEWLGSQFMVSVVSDGR